jgi:hypothetical protein
MNAKKAAGAAKAAMDLLQSYRMQLLWPPAKGLKRARGRVENAHHGLYLAGVTAKMAEDIIEEEPVFVPAPRMTPADLDRIKRRKALSRKITSNTHDD